MSVVCVSSHASMGPREDIDISGLRGYCFELCFVGKVVRLEQYGEFRRAIIADQCYACPECLGVIWHV